MQHAWAKWEMCSAAWEAEGKRTLGRPVTADRPGGQAEGVNWSLLVQDRERWRALVNTAPYVRVPYKTRIFLNRWVTVSFQERVCSMDLRSQLSNLTPWNRLFSWKADSWSANKNSSISIVSDYRLGDQGSIPGRSKGMFPLASVSRPALRPTQPPVQWVLGVLSLG
jgi:hypothetical protein